MIDARKCTGCGVCSLVCPHGCIRMLEDEEGFRQPCVDETHCINCGLCQKKCPVLSVNHSSIQRAYAVKNAKEEIREKSTSGGVFFELAKDILSRGGVVCAAKYDEDFQVVHKCACTLEEVCPMMGAKYAQSRAEHCFGEIKEYLKEGKEVLFVGTPCQTAALHTYLGKPYDGLCMVDMICHGVPSPAVWQKYLHWRKKTDFPMSTLNSVNLRSKETGWSKYSYAVEMRYDGDQRYIVKQNEDPYMQGFVQNLFLRQSCSQCTFKGNSRQSDMTLGDFWGIWDLYPEFDDNKGTSLLLIRTEKGMRAWQRIRLRFEVLEVNYQQALSYNPSALISSVSHEHRKAFFEMCTLCDDLGPCIGQYLRLEGKKPNIFVRMVRKVKRIFQKGVKNR